MLGKALLLLRIYRLPHLSRNAIELFELIPDLAPARANGIRLRN